MFVGNLTMYKRCIRMYIKWLNSNLWLKNSVQYFMIKVMLLIVNVLQSCSDCLRATTGSDMWFASMTRRRWQENHQGLKAPVLILGMCKVACCMMFNWCTVDAVCTSTDSLYLSLHHLWPPHPGSHVAIITLPSMASWLQSPRVPLYTHVKSPCCICPRRLKK